MATFNVLCRTMSVLTFYTSRIVYSQTSITDTFSVSVLIAILTDFDRLSVRLYN
jgi:hypothetical protein